MIPHHRIRTPRRKLEAVLNRPELEGMAPAEKAEALSMFLAELERRIGLALLPLLDASSERQFRDLMAREAESDEIIAFFSVRIPDYRALVGQIVDAFCEECRESLGAAYAVSASS